MKNFVKKVTVIAGIALLFNTTNAIAQEKVIQKSQLPKPAQSFIDTHFKGKTISYAIEDTDYYVIDEYQVVFDNGMKVEFDSRGNWKEVDGNKLQIPDQYIPASIKSYVKKSFPNTQIVKIEKGRWKYEVDLSNGLGLEFNSKGEFKKVDD